MALHLPIGPLKTCSGLEPARRCDPLYPSPLADDIATTPFICYYKISTIKVKWRLCHVNLRTNKMYILSSNTLFGEGSEM